MATPARTSTSPTGAAIHDFLQVLRRRWRGVDVLVIPARVQGDGAAQRAAVDFGQAEARFFGRDDDVRVAFVLNCDGDLRSIRRPTRQEGLLRRPCEGQAVAAVAPATPQHHQACEGQRQRGQQRVQRAHR